MSLRMALFFTAVSIILIKLPGGRGETQPLTVRDKGTIKLQTKEDLKLKGDFQILWYVKLRGQEEKLNLLYFDGGNWSHHPPDQFKDKLHLNETTGALTLRSLSAGESGVYYADIVDENNGVHHVEYNITVKDPVPNPVTTGPSRNTTTDPPKDQRNHTAAITAGSVAGVVFCLLAIVSLVFHLIKKKKEVPGYVLTGDSQHAV